MAQQGNIYINFGLWGISLFPAWLVVRKVGVTLGDRKVERERAAAADIVAVDQGQEQESK